MEVATVMQPIGLQSLGISVLVVVILLGFCNHFFWISCPQTSWNVC